MKKAFLPIWILAIVAFSVSTAFAEVTVPALLSDHMVLQRDLPTHFWGSAVPGESVTVSFRGEKKTTAADEVGRWHIYLSPAPAGGPFEVTIQGQNTIVLHDVLVGDIWVASGQSNMEFPLSRAEGSAADIAAATFPNIRVLEVKKAYSDFPLEDISTTGWKASSPEVAGNFSAIAFYFARELHQREKVPVGIIDSYWGGTVVEAWTSMRALTADASLMPVFAAQSRMWEDYVNSERRRKLDDAKVAEAKAKGLPRPNVPWHPDPHSWEPAGLFNAMIAPLTALPIRGVIWYQGESNSQLTRAPQLYGRQFQAMIRDWREHWNEGEFPFYYVQIANYKSWSGEDWPAVRQGQRQALELRMTGMAVTIDIGNPDDVHPLDKRDVGARLALIARANLFGESIEFSGPMSRSVTREHGALRVWFDHVGKGLEARGGPLTSFEVAGADGQFHPAEARIDGATLLVSSSSVAEPVAVRYGWSNSPVCNLFNRDGLPASPFMEAVPPLH